MATLDPETLAKFILRQEHREEEFRAKETALRIARNRDIFDYWATLYAAFTGVVGAGAYVKQKPILMVSLFPPLLLTAYMWDFAYGKKQTRLTRRAEEILKDEPELVKQPSGPKPANSPSATIIPTTYPESYT